MLVFLRDNLRVPGDLTFLGPCSLCFPLWAPLFRFHIQQTSAGPLRVSLATQAETQGAYKVRGGGGGPGAPLPSLPGGPEQGIPRTALPGGPQNTRQALRNRSLCAESGFNILPVLIVFPEMETWVEMICSSPDFSECVYIWVYF